ncbi:hypothetical protein [Flavicella sediminum]|uniref:hypothetical protein n=1 Tax=Flavicella sediminum TaxID=2585141 RepID=UPI0011213FAF|nr:hypothetical protein [Flavicella sediminum]
MKSVFNIINAARNLLNVEVVRSSISGSIYKVEAPKKGLEDITINVLTIGGDYLQRGVLNVNLYLKDLKSGLANTKRFEELSNIILPLLDNKKAVDYDITMIVNGQEQSLFEDHSYVFFEIDSPGVILKDQERENTHFLNIKLKYQTL